MSNEALIRLILSTILLTTAHILIRRYVMPIWNRFEARSREKAEKRLNLHR